MATASGTSALLGYTYPAAGQYTIYVFAVQADGIGYFAGTKQVTVGDTPAAPTDFSATVVCGHEINLAWTDNSNIEIGYLIEQSPDGEGDWLPVAWTDADSAYHSLPGPFAPNTDYYFRVAAFTASAQSQYSNITDVTTGSWPPKQTGDPYPAASQRDCGTGGTASAECQGVAGDVAVARGTERAGLGCLLQGFLDRLLLSGGECAAEDLDVVAGRIALVPGGRVAGVGVALAGVGIAGFRGVGGG